MAQFGHVPLPNISLGDRPAETTIDEYRSRVADAARLLRDNDLDAAVVYGDREYFGDIYHLTGVDPRFEEGILILSSAGVGTLLLGNEDFDFGPAREIGHAVELWQDLSPAGQRRDKPARLHDLLGRAGITSGVRVGLNGQKRMDPEFFDGDEVRFSAPHYLVETVRDAVGATGSVTDIKELFTDPATGLRARASAHDIALFEFGASVSSLSVLRVMQGIEVGVYADALSDVMIRRGLADTAHAMVNFASSRGLNSPRHLPARLGEKYQIAHGVRGGLTCRTGMVASSASELVGPARGMYEPLVLNYFDTLVAWWESVAVGADSEHVFAATDAVRDPELFDFALNPGHSLHYEEWSHSSFWPGHGRPLVSGNVLQCDIIPATTVSFMSVDIEDGIALADAALRAELAADYPDLWDRVQRRRAFLTDEIGIRVADSVLPLSNMPLWHAPFVLDPTINLVRR